MKTTHSVARGALLTVLAAMLGFIEASVMPPSYGGIKIGIGNAAVLAALYTMNQKWAFLVGIGKVFLCAALYAGFAPMLYSLCGAVLSIAAQCLLKKTGLFSIVGVSSMGAMFHNTGQLLCAYFLMGRGVMAYFPFLMVCGAFGGLLTGILTKLIIERGGRFFGKEKLSAPVRARAERDNKKT